MGEAMHNLIQETRNWPSAKTAQLRASTLNIHTNTKDNQMINDKPKKVTIRFKAYLPQGEKIFETRGQTAKALLFLVDSAQRGVTALEVANWAYRMAAYVHILRSKYGLEIRTDKEPHVGGSHARYVLITPVDIISQTNK